MSDDLVKEFSINVTTKTKVYTRSIFYKSKVIEPASKKYIGFLRWITLQVRLRHFKEFVPFTYKGQVFAVPKKDTMMVVGEKMSGICIVKKNIFYLYRTTNATNEEWNLLLQSTGLLD